MLKELFFSGNRVYHERLKTEARTFSFFWPIYSQVQAVQLTKFDYRLSNRLANDLQKLRCRVNYHALRYTDPIVKMGMKLVQRMRMKSNHYVALHLRYFFRSTLFTRPCC